MKKNNNGIKGAVLSLSLAATVGGWVALGSSQDQQDGVALGTVDANSKAPEAMEEAVDPVPIPRTVPVAALLGPPLDQDQEASNGDLPPIPTVVPSEHRRQAATHPVAPLPSPPSAIWSSERVVQTLPVPQVSLMREPSQTPIEGPEPSSNGSAMMVPKKELPSLELAPLPKISSVFKEPQSEVPPLAPLPVATTIEARHLTPLPTISPLQKPQIAMAKLASVSSANSDANAGRVIRQPLSLPSLPSPPQSSVEIPTLELKPITTINPPQRQPVITTRSSQ